MALSKEQMQVIARNATLRGKTPDTARRSTPKNSRPNSAASTGRKIMETTRRPTTQEYAGLTARPKDDEVVLVCPENTVPGESLFFRDGGLKCKTTVPKNVRPGQRFKVRKSECSVNGQPAKRPPRPSRAQSAPSRRDPKPKAFQAPLNFPETKPPHDPYQDVDKKDPYRDPFVRDLPNVTWKDRQLIEEYKKRRDAGLVTDEAYWQEQGFKAVGDPSKISEKKKKDYGFGAPKWSPYYRSNQTKEQIEAIAKAPVESALGDQEWWEQFGFKGAVSEEKKRDYGNGVPGWSPYSRVRSGGPLVRTGLPADAYWFSQFGFKMGQVSEEKKRDYGFGIPFWSPYNRPKGGPQRAASAPPTRS